MENLRDLDVSFELQPFLRQGARQAQQRGKSVVISVSRPVEPFDAIELFERAHLATSDRYLWAQPGESFALVGLGIAHAIDAVEASRFRQVATAWRHLLTEAIAEGPRGLPGVGPVLLGGFSFDTYRAAGALWQGYPHGHFVLPRLLFTQVKAETWLTWNVLVGPNSDPDAEAARLSSFDQLWLASESGPARGNGHSSNPGEAARIVMHELRPAAEWRADVANAVRAIRNEELEKVVLARAVRLRSSQPFLPGRALRHLAAHYTGCYVFAVARGDRCFLGATPEQLVRLRDGEIRTMSLAGSIRRGETPEEDQRLGQALLDSAKDRGEHAVVVQALVEALGETCARLLVPETPSLLKLGNIQHLYTPITGQSSDGCTLLDLAERLHPTPAVGGRPRDAALRLIRECEDLDRGWYTGAVGWLNGQGEGELAVALRSAMLHADEATLFAGCGIMADSDPEREYAESSLKLNPMLAALNSP